MFLTNNIARPMLGSINSSWTTFTQGASSSLARYSGLILATSATALLGLGIYRLSHSKDIKKKEKDDFDFAQVKKRIQKVYKYVFGGFALTAASAAVFHIGGLSKAILTRKSYLIPIGLTVASCGSLITTLLTSKENKKIKHIAWGVFNISMGALLSPIGYLNKAVVAQAAAISLGLGGLLSLAAYYAPDKAFLKWEGPLMAALTSLTVASTVALFFPGTAFAYGVDRVSLYGGLALFSALMMSGTQRLMDEAKNTGFDAINASVSIYLDGMNIFVRILQILLENQKKD